MTYDPVAAGAQCRLCPLAKKRATVVPPAWAQGRFTRSPRLIVIGEGPGRMEEREGFPFIGPSGQVLNELLGPENAPLELPRGLKRSEVHVTNAMLCRGERDWDKEIAAACCAPRLLREVEAFGPEVPILTLGKPAARAILGVKSIMLARGFVWTAKEIDPKAVSDAYRKVKKTPKGVEDRNSALTVRQVNRLKAMILEGRSKLAGRTVFPTLHPAFVLRSEGKSTDMWRPIIEIDVNRALRWIASGGELRLADRAKYKVVGDGVEAARALAKLGKVVAVDIETDDVLPLTMKILCIGVSDGKRTVVLHPDRSLDRPWEATGLIAAFQRFIDGKDGEDVKRKVGSTASKIAA